MRTRKPRRWRCSLCALANTGPLCVHCDTTAVARTGGTITCHPGCPICQRHINTPLGFAIRQMKNRPAPTAAEKHS